MVVPGTLSPIKKTAAGKTAGSLTSIFINFGAAGRSRTGTPAKALDFESSASANSATAAHKYGTKLYYHRCYCLSMDFWIHRIPLFSSRFHKNAAATTPSRAVVHWGMPMEICSMLFACCGSRNRLHTIPVQDHNVTAFNSGANT